MTILKTLIAVSAISATPAMAAVNITFSDIQASWVSPIGGQDIVNPGPPSSNVAIFWGDVDHGESQSGYRFQSNIPIITVDPLTQTSGVTSIGTFTHYNFPIDSGSGISGVKLNLTMNVKVDDMLVQNVNFIYAFNHWETPNGANPCANGQPHGVGVNNPSCADNVSVNFLQESGFFTINNIEYALDIRGFLAGGNPVTSFWTREGKENVAELRGQVVLRSVAGSVPEPATWAMMIGGFAAMGGTLRRKKTSVAYA